MLGWLDDSRDSNGRGGRRRLQIATIAYATALACFTVLAQIHQVGGIHYLETTQVARHLDVMDGLAFDPWTYRVLSDLGVDGLYNALRGVGVGRPWVVSFIAFRVVQNIAIFLLAAVYYRRLGLSRVAAAFGLGLIAWGLMATNADSDLRFDTWSDVIVFLVAALILLEGDRAFPWLIPLTAVGALNRETSGVIALMLLAVAFREGLGTRTGRRTAFIAGCSLVLWAAIYLGLRKMIGPRQDLIAHGHPGWELFRFNVTHRETWINLFATVGVLPFACLYAWRRWSTQLRVIALAVVPLWVAVHFVAAVARETRVFVVPDVLVFVPGALVALKRLEPRAYSWGRAAAVRARERVAGRIMKGAGAVLMVGSLFVGWYSLQPVRTPFSPAHPGPIVRVSAFSHVSAAAVALLCVSVVALTVSVVGSGRGFAVAGVVAGVALVGISYSQLVGVEGLHFFPRGFPREIGGLFHLPPTAPPPRILPVNPPDVPNSVNPIAGAYIAAAASLLVLCASLYRLFAEVVTGANAGAATAEPR